MGSALVLSAPGAYSNSTLGAGGMLIQCRILDPTNLAVKRPREPGQGQHQRCEGDSEWKKTSGCVDGERGAVA
jgi:hypothetical protein